MIKVDIWSDLNCPFCYMGKRHFEKALMNFSKPQIVVVEWKSFELDPIFKPSPKDDSTDLLARKYGRSRQWAQELNFELTEMASLIGLDFHLDKMIPSNSFNAHRLLHLAKSKSLLKQNDLIEILFSYKFCKGLDINSVEHLISAANLISLPIEEIQRVIRSDDFKEAVRMEEDQAEALSIRSVPYFRFNKSLSLCGAKSPEDFLTVLKSFENFVVDEKLNI